MNEFGFIPDSESRAQANSVPGEFGFIPDSGEPGSSPANPLPETHPEVPRFAIMNFANKEGAIKGLRDQNFQAEPIPGGDEFDIAVKRPNEAQWRVVRPHDWSPRRVLDWISDIGKGGAEALGGIGGAALGGPIGAVGGAAASGGASELAKQKIANALGYNQPTEWGDVGKEALIGGTAEGVFRALPAAGKALKGLLGAPYAAEKAITGEGERIAERQALRGVKTARGALLGEQERVLSQIPRAAAQPVGEAAAEAAERPAAKIATEGAENAWTDQAAKLTPEAVDVALHGAEGTPIRIMAEMIHPAWGIKAENLRYVPDLLQGWQGVLGRNFRNIIGSESMAAGDQFLKSITVGKTPEEVAQIGSKLAEVTGKWMKGHADTLSKIEQVAAEKLARGEIDPEAAKVANNVILDAIRGPLERLRPLKDTLRARRAAYAEAQAKRAAPGLRNDIGDIFSGEGGRQFRRIVGGAVETPLVRVPAAAGLVLNWIAQQAAKQVNPIRLTAANPIPLIARLAATQTGRKLKEQNGA